MITANEYEARRKALFDRMEENSIAILFSGVSKKKSGDELYPFESNHNFVYLTGIEQEDSILLLIDSEGERKQYLFLSPFDAAKEKWYGKRLSAEEATAISGIRNILLNTALVSRVDSYLNGNNAGFAAIKRVFLDLEKENKIQESTTTEDYARSLRLAYPSVETRDIQPTIVALRRVKSQNEIAEITNAVEIAMNAMRSSMAEVRPGIGEYEIASTFVKTVNDANAGQGVSHAPIVASGAHATTLAYLSPKGKCQMGETLLLDCGAKSNFYCSDLARVVPTDGKFSPEAKRILSILSGCQRALIAYCRPGLSATDLQSFALEYLAAECVDKGLIPTKEGIRAHAFHVVSHHIGMDRHDAGDRSRPFEEGNVLTIEPGLYFPEKGIGMRLKDVVVLTREGSRCLSDGLIRTPEEIESFYTIR